MAMFTVIRDEAAIKDHQRLRCMEFLIIISGAESRPEHPDLTTVWLQKSFVAAHVWAGCPIYGQPAAILQRGMFTRYPQALRRGRLRVGNVEKRLMHFFRTPRKALMRLLTLRINECMPVLTVLYDARLN